MVKRTLPRITGKSEFALDYDYLVGENYSIFS
jgi:hypothetical protein